MFLYSTWKYRHSKKRERGWGNEISKNHPIINCNTTLTYMTDRFEDLLIFNIKDYLCRHMVSPWSTQSKGRRLTVRSQPRNLTKKKRKKKKFAMIFNCRKQNHCCKYQAVEKDWHYASTIWAHIHVCCYRSFMIEGKLRECLGRYSINVYQL